MMSHKQVEPKAIPLRQGVGGFSEVRRALERGADEFVDGTHPTAHESCAPGVSGGAHVEARWSSRDWAEIHRLAAEIRDLLGTSRKYALPICEHLDRVGVTKRVGDVRVPGAKA